MSDLRQLRLGVVAIQLGWLELSDLASHWQAFHQDFLSEKSGPIADLFQRLVQAKVVTERQIQQLQDLVDSSHERDPFETIDEDPQASESQIDSRLRILKQAFESNDQLWNEEALLNLVFPFTQQSNVTDDAVSSVQPALANDKTQQDSTAENSSSNPRYKKLKEHARGGLGAVYVAEDTELPREVALKEMLPHQEATPFMRNRFLREAEITGGLEHPGIVPVYGMGVSADGRPFYAMRFIRGKDFYSAIHEFHEIPNQETTQKSLKLRQLLDRFRDVCQAVQYAHDQNILHRDIKPQNIVLGDYGETMLVDWGLAKSLAHPFLSPTDKNPKSSQSALNMVPHALSDSHENSVVGTPVYMSTEQAKGDAVGRPSDIYSLGATLYHLLTGKVPFADSKDLKKLIEAKLEQPAPDPHQENPDIPKPLAAVCMKAMANREQDRYLSAIEISKTSAEITRTVLFKNYREMTRLSKNGTTCS